MGLLDVFKREIRRSKKEDKEKKDNILDCIRRSDFSELGVDIQLVEEIFYKALEAGIIKIVPSSNGGVKISVSNMEVETFPMCIKKDEILKYFYID